MRAYRARNPQAGRDANTRSRYGLTQEDIAEMYRLTCGLCAICGAAEPLQIDHEHATGRVRSLLCGRCNRTLGHVKESPELLNTMAAYVAAQP